MPVNTRKLRREFEAAKKDRKPHLFFEELYDALDKKELVPEDFSVRQLFEEFVEDGREIVDSWNARHGGGGIMLMEAGNAIDTSVFSNISGQIVYTRMLEKFTSEEYVFSRAIPDVPTKFSGERIPGITNIGDEAEIIDELQAYPMAGVSEDYIDTPEEAPGRREGYAGFICCGKFHRFTDDEKAKHGADQLWTWIRERIRNHHGIWKRNTGFYLKELEWKYNHRSLDPEVQAQKIIELMPMNFLTSWSLKTEDTPMSVQTSD
jgi:hypothetical protein